MALNLRESFRRNRVALTTAAAIAGASVLGAFSASAQEALTDAQCMSAKGAVIATLRDYRGKMSAPLAESLGEFAKTCDLKTKFNRVPGQDDVPWDVFRLQITNIRLSANAAPAALTQR
jgi:hypothetical protein